MHGGGGAKSFPLLLICQYSHLTCISKHQNTFLIVNNNKFSNKCIDTLIIIFSFFLIENYKCSLIITHNVLSWGSKYLFLNVCGTQGAYVQARSEQPSLIRLSAKVSKLFIV